MKKVLLSILFLIGISSAMLVAHTIAPPVEAVACSCNDHCNGLAPDNVCSIHVGCNIKPANRNGICGECPTAGSSNSCGAGKICQRFPEGKLRCVAIGGGGGGGGGPEPGYSPPPASLNCKLPNTDIMLVIDESRSMGNNSPTNMSRAKFAARAFVRTIQNSTDFSQVRIRIGVASFNERGQVQHRPTDNLNATINAINSLNPSNDGGTCLECALDHPNGNADVLDAFNGGGQTKKVVIILTDGNITRWVNNSGQIVGGASAQEQQTGRQQARAAAVRLNQRFNNSVQFWVAQFGNGDHGADFRDIVNLPNPYYGPGKWTHVTGNNWDPLFETYASNLRGGFIYAGAYSIEGPALPNWTAVLSCSTGSRTALTDGTGIAKFFSVPGGSDYRVSFATPAGYGAYPPETSSQIAGITVGAPPGGAFGNPCTAAPSGSDECDQTTTRFMRLGSIAGCVFNDVNSSGTMDAGETYPTSLPPPTVRLTGTLWGGLVTFIPQTRTSACFSFPNLYYGDYTLSYSNIPTGYKLTNPLSGPNYIIRYYGVSNCTANPQLNGQPACANGNITNANFGITNALPWIQTAAFNVRNDRGGFNNPIQPSSVCGTTMLRDGNGGSPGILYTAGANLFSPGSASSRNWVVANSASNPTRYNPGERLKTSYSEMMLALTRNETPTTSLTSLSSCRSLSSCSISSLSSQAYTANGTVRLGSVRVSGGQKAVILITGDLQITQNVTVDPGSFLMFIVQGDIIVEPTVGRTANHLCAGQAGAELQGIFVTHGDFHALGTTCPTPDAQLNVAGSIITNADAASGGQLINDRHLCATNLQRPALTITPRLDFILNAPIFMLRPSTTWEEVAP